ncbi:MAG: ASCH domain-containing protein [Nanoarchaeota archaeon]|nr:ASCH domain-containing protein [Nanoarchaeota archaeon]
MKALSIRQPWVELILSGKKSIELRSWNTNFRGDFFVHASKTVNNDECARFKLDSKKLVTGALVGKANLIGVVKYEDEKMFLKDYYNHFSKKAGKFPVYGFVLGFVGKIKPVKCKGSLNFFKV